MNDRSFFDASWSMFRTVLKGIFVVVSLLYIFCAITMLVCSGDLFRLAPHELILVSGSAVVMGLFVVSYITLLLAIPLSVFCAIFTLVLTLFGRVDETSFPQTKRPRAWPGYPIPPAPDPRIEIIEAKTEKDAAICPVCAAAISDEHVSCSKCDVPHHPECWDYNGSCATFGCGGCDPVSPGLRPAEPGRMLTQGLPSLDPARPPSAVSSDGYERDGGG